MPAYINPGVQTSKSGGVGASMATLRSGLSLDGLEAKLFADILSQTTVAPEPVISRKLADIKPRTPSSAQSGVATANTSPDTAAEDRAALRSLLQRIREDAKALYQNRQRIRHLDRKADQAEAQENPVKDETAKQAVPGQTQTTAPEEIAAVEETEDTAVCLYEGEDCDSGNEFDVLTDSKVIEMAKLLLTDPETKSAADTAGSKNPAKEIMDETEVKALLDDLMSAEQAALLLISKLMQDKAEKLKQGLNDRETVADAALGNAAEETGATVTDPVETVFGGQAMSLALPKLAKGSAQGALPLTADADSGADTNAANAVMGGKAFETLMPSLAGAKGKPQEKATDGATAHKAGDDFLTLFNVNAGVASNAPAKGIVDATVVKAGVAAEVTGAGEVGSAAAASSHAQGSQHAMLTEGAKPVGSYDFASQLSAARAARGGSAGLPTAVEQVALQLHKGIKEGQNQMTVHLRPADLGRIDIKLTFSADKTVQGTVVADNPATLDLLLKDVGSLQRALQDAGLRADPGSLQFSLRGDGQQNLFNANSNGHSGNGSSSGYAPSVADVADIEPEYGAEIYYLTPGRINLRV